MLSNFPSFYIHQLFDTKQLYEVATIIIYIFQINTQKGQINYLFLNSIAMIAN